MSMFRYQPTVILESRTTLANPTMLPVLTQTSGGSLNGTYSFKWAAAHDGAGVFHTFPSPAASITATNAKKITVDFSSQIIAGARWFLAYKFHGPSSSYRLVYSGSEPRFDDYSTPNDSFVWPESLLNTTTSGTKVIYDMRPDGTFLHPKRALEGRIVPNGFDLVSQCELTYLDQAIDPAGEEQSVRRNLVQKQIGVRPTIDLSCSVDPGSDEEDALVAIYGAKLAFPDIETSISLNYPSGVPIIRKVLLVGDCPRHPSDSVNTRLLFEWQFRAVSIIKSVPPMLAVESSMGAIW